MQRLNDRVAVVTGAANGIGRGLAEELAERGSKVVLVDIDEPKLRVVTSELQAKGADVVAEVVDVSRADEMTALAERSLSRFGAVHVLCNNAGVAVTGTAPWDVDLEDWNYIVGVNLMGVIHGLRAFMPILLRQEEAHVVNTSSLTGLTLSVEGGGAYGPTKHAVVALSESTKLYLLMMKAPVGVSCLCPGEVNTDIVTNATLRYQRLGRQPTTTPIHTAFQRASARWLVKAGMAPREVARLTCEAILEDRFYVLPHPNHTRWIEVRMSAILQDGAPALHPMQDGVRELFEEELRLAGVKF